MIAAARSLSQTEFTTTNQLKIGIKVRQFSHNYRGPLIHRRENKNEYTGHARNLWVKSYVEDKKNKTKQKTETKQMSKLLTT